ncbi:TetR/AcrR family transcriptional regulator [bacterium]|nr:TetR/AcrR family transcriptional regulator [bacterium]
MQSVQTRGRPRQNPAIRKNQILTAAIKLFAEKGYHPADLQELANNLAIAKGTIYLYFPSKYDLFLAAVEHAVKKLALQITTEVDNVDAPDDKIQAMVRAYFSFFDHDSLLAEIMVIGRGEVLRHAEAVYIRIFRKNLQYIESIVEAGIQQGCFRTGNPKETAVIISNLLHGTMYIHVLNKRTIHSNATIEATIAFLLQGILK